MHQYLESNNIIYIIIKQAILHNEYLILKVYFDASTVFLLWLK